MSRNHGLHDERVCSIYVFLGVRSNILLELDFTKIIRGIYEGSANSRDVLYYPTYSGGKFLVEHLSERLVLRGRDLLVKTLKAYQTDG